MQSCKNDFANPPAVADLFKIPAGLSPAWQALFDKVAAFYERQSASERHVLKSLERRRWLTDAERLREFEMLLSAKNMKKTGECIPLPLLRTFGLIPSCGGRLDF